MIPLVAVNDAPDAPPLVVTVGSERARVHLLVQRRTRGALRAVGELSVDDVRVLQAAVQCLVTV